MSLYNKEITVVLALYNGMQYIEKQLDSLRMQTKKIDQLIIGDDCSTDGSVEFVKEYILKYKLDKEWSIKRNKMNKGHAENFINLCQYAEGKFIFFCDQDDIWMTSKIEMMINIMKENKDINVLYADVINTDKPDNKKSADNIIERKSISRVPFTEENYFFKGLGCSMCVRGTFLKDMLPYWTKGWEHDMFFWGCAIITDSGYYYNYPVIWRRIHATNASITDKKTLEKRLEQVKKSLCRPIQLRKLVEDLRINDDYKIQFINKYEHILNRRYVALKKRNPFMIGINFFGGYKFYLHKFKGIILDMYLIIFKKYPIGGNK